MRVMWAGWLFAFACGGGSGQGDRPDAAVNLGADSDSDAITDGDEGRAESVDTDGDGTLDYLDLDSDGDCVPDAVEAGDAELATTPVDSDSDGRPDYRDRDSDDDRLSDTVEDSNCNGARDGTETTATVADTDGDGASDTVEVAVGTDANALTDNPAANGDVVLVAPYLESAPAAATLAIDTTLQQVDILLLVDTTGSMSAEIAQIQNGLANLLSLLAAGVPSVGFGVATFADFGDAGCYGTAGDRPFTLTHRIMTTTTSAGRTSLQNAVAAFSGGGGGDEPESTWQAVYQAAQGTALIYNSIAVPAFSATTAPPTTAPAGEAFGTLPGVGFRAGSLPLVMLVSDAPGHNSVAYALSAPFSGTDAASTDAANNYPIDTCPALSVATTKATALDAARSKAIRIVSIVSSGGTGRPDLATAPKATRAYVPSSAWDGLGGRPAGCAASACCTGLNGVGVTAVNGVCPLVYDLNTEGTGLVNAVAGGALALYQHGRFDITASATDVDAADTVDPRTAFVDGIEAVATSVACTTSATPVDTDTSGAADTFRDVPATEQVCFRVMTKQNTSVQVDKVPKAYAMMLTGIADDVARVTAQRLWFVVPPAADGP